jgi:hypothetical protein
VHINADHLLRNHRAGIIRVRGAGPWLLMLGTKYPFTDLTMTVSMSVAGMRETDPTDIVLELPLRCGTDTQ